ncbi:proteasomal ubiquitin receptor ADRM1 homolog [Rhynchophorus ferrugineus]|uniref:proteasomal ubiquitin receptor ADRM1 homolog n=1 Tax=Rhynchophorus ferrugineus TaxID=354439 RepID=UPI003FCDC854
MPAGGALFGRTATGPGSTGGNKHLVEMKAGKMNLKGKMVYPDKRKGLLYIYQSEDSLMHFCWQDRTTGVVEDDLIIFPDDCEYVKVPQCTTGRAYLLKFKLTNRKFFFWLQEPKTDNDVEHCVRINDLLNNPSTAAQSSDRPEQDLQALLNSMSQAQLMQLFGGAEQMTGLSSLLGTMRGPGSARTTVPALTHRTAASTPTTTTSTTAPQPPAATTPTTPQNAPIPVSTPDAPRIVRTSAVAPDPNPSTTPIRLSDLQNFLQGISAPAAAIQQPQSVDLSSALTTDALSSIINSPEALQQLQEHLPPIDANTQEALRSTLISPQFQQAVSQFSSALESGQLGPVVSQLAVNPEAVAAAASGNMQEFVKALEKNSGSSSETNNKDKNKGAKKDTKKDDDDEEMQLD